MGVGQILTWIAKDLCIRLSVLLDLGLGYLSLERSTPALSLGELQRLSLATQMVSNLFRVICVLDEPAAGLYSAETAAHLRALDGLKYSGNSLLAFEHDPDVVPHAPILKRFSCIRNAESSGQQECFFDREEAMMTIDEQMTEWLSTRDRIAAHIATLDTRKHIHLVGDAAAEAARASLAKLRVWQEEIDALMIDWLMHG